MYVIIICISCLCRVNVILHMRYCNLWWCIHNEYSKYTISSGTSNNYEIMANIISTGGNGVWRCSTKENGTYGAGVYLGFFMKVCGGF